MKRTGAFILAFFSGVTNVVFGSGGGILAVESLKNKGLEQKYAQATALCATLIMSVFSTGYYLYYNYFDFKDALMYVPFGIPGAVVGSCFLRKIPNKYLKKCFGALIILAGARMIF